MGGVGRLCGAARLGRRHGLARPLGLGISAWPGGRRPGGGCFVFRKMRLVQGLPIRNSTFNLDSADTLLPLINVLAGDDIPKTICSYCREADIQRRKELCVFPDGNTIVKVAKILDCCRI